MEPENENWSQPSYESQTEPSTPQEPERKSFFQQEGLQRTLLNVKLATWLKCLIVIAALAVTAVLVAPKFTTAQQSQQQETSYSEFQEDWYEDYEEDWYDDSQEEWYDDSEEEWYDDSEDWYDDCYDDYYEY